MRHFAIAAWTIGLCALTGAAQEAPRKEPVQYAGTERAPRAGVQPPGIRLGLRKPHEFALAPLSESEVARFTESSTRLKVGIERSVPPEALSNGAWETTLDGARVWRMAIRSPGSRGIRIEFRNFSAGAGQVWLHDGSRVAGPYTNRGTFDDGRFWSDTLFSESATLEYEPAADAPAGGLPPFEIHTISHHIRSVFGAAGRASAPEPGPAGSSSAAAQSPAGPSTAPQAGIVNTADYCELDPNCYGDWQGAMTSVGQILFEDGGDAFLCSGSLVATRDNSFKPYFLTAGHCINNEAAARTVQAYWTYQTSSCGGAWPVSRDAGARSSTGSHLIASAPLELGDYSLILLNDVPAGVTFAGWDTSDPPSGAPLTGIHHPSGSWKRISFGARAGDVNNLVGSGTAPAGMYLQVQWDKGRVEHGSSGSPLFSSPGVIVGSLSYGPVLSDGTVCSINPSVAGYSRFSNAYANVKDYLENLPAAEVKPDTANLSFSVANHSAPSGQAVQLTTQSAGQSSFKLRADASWIRLSTMTGTVSAKSPAQVTITADPSQLDQPGQYSSTVTIFSGAAAPRFVNVTATVRLDQSNVVPAITPNPVVQSGGQWDFQIRLQETAGAATRVTGIKINGTDYSSAINDWFGASRIAGNSAIVAPLHGTGLFPAGDQYFEFWGIDDASNLPWYRVTTVKFQ